MQLTRSLSLLAAAASGVVALTPAAAASTSASVECRYEPTVTSFGFGFAAALKVTNTGTEPATGWWIEFDLPPEVLIQTTYGGRFASHSGHIRVTAPDWLPTVAPGRYATVGFNGRLSAPITVTASNVTLNGAPCTA